MLNNISQFQINAAGEEFDFTTAHPKKMDGKDSPDLERYFTAFLTFSKQSRPDWFSQTAQPTASDCFAVIADFLKERFRNSSIDENGNENSIALIEPCIDNLPALLKDRDLKLKVVSDNLLKDDFGKILEIDSSVIFLVLPNNPTGQFISQKNFELLARHCAETKKVLIIDACFRAYVPKEKAFDQYEILAKYGVPSLVIEDSGKFIYEEGDKLAFISVSSDLKKALNNKSTNYNINFSKRVVRILTNTLEQANDNNHPLSLMEDVKKNRILLYETIRSYNIKVIGENNATTAWLDVSALMPGREFVSLLDNANTKILSGREFFWSDKEKGNSFVRIGLARPTDRFEKAMQNLAYLLEYHFCKPNKSLSNEVSP